MKCCGNEVETPFCPMCGEKAIHPLLVYCNSRRDEYEEWITKWEKATANQEDLKELHADKSYKKKLANAVKWQAWADFVTEAVEAANGDPSDPAGARR